ncbi:class I SAM-dependent methyltransferase [Angustibacter aerolatus]
MDVGPVRAAYDAAADRYAELFDGAWRPDPADEAFVRRHLVGLDGPVLDVGCGPGWWTAHLHGLGARVTGVDPVPRFVVHARAHHPGPAFGVGAFDDPGVPDHSQAGVLSWYSTIHLSPAELPAALAALRRLLVPGGVLVLGFFDGAEVAPFDHAVTTAHHWPVDVLAQRLADAGLVEVDRLQRTTPERPDRRYAALAARAV